VLLERKGPSHRSIPSNIGLQPTATGGIIGAAAPLEWFPRLRAATAEQRARWQFIGGGIGVHWPDLDEDLSVAALLATR
jgi:hypothetical protein